MKKEQVAVNTGKKKKTDKAMSLFGRSERQTLFISRGILARRFKRGIDTVVSTLSKMVAKDRVTALINRSGETAYACRIPTVLSYTSWELIEHIADKYFNSVGRWLSDRLAKKQPTKLKIEDLTAFEKELELPAQFIFYFVKCFVDCGLIVVDRSYMLSLAQKDSDLSAAKLKNVVVARKLATHADQEDPSFLKDDLFSILGKLHSEHNAKTQLTVIPIKVHDVFSVCHICEIRIGHQDTDFRELESTVVRLESMTRAERPDLLVVSGLIQGSFQHTQKSRRSTLVKGLKSSGQQLALAKLLMRRLSSLGITVILNKGDDDKIWCENTVVFMMKAIDEHHTPDKKKKSAHFMQIDRMKGTQMWDMVYDFAWRIALEYQIRVGRRFYSADEVFRMTNGGIKMEESILLLLAYKGLTSGESLPSDYGKVLDVDKIPLPGKSFDDFAVVDDCCFDVIIKDRAHQFSRRISIMNKHFFRLTANSMIGDPTSAMRSIAAQLNSMGVEKPDVMFIEHELQPFVFATRHTLVASMPGMQLSNIGRRSQYSNIQSDPSHRVMTTRREVAASGTMPLSFYADGSFEVSMVNRHYMGLAGVSKERIAIPLCFDWQTGSVTANSDLQAIFFDYCMHHILPNYPMYLFYGGDIVQGFNYSHHAFENQRMGLVSVDSQKDFLRSLILCTLTEVPKKDLVDNLKHVGIVPGNHEWNSGSKWPGVIHCEMIKSAFELAFMNAGVFIPVLGGDPNDSRIKVYDSAQDSVGNHYKVWAGHQQVGGYGFRFQHMLVERGTKGQGGPPVYALKSQLTGNSESMTGVDILVSGHWHSPQVLKVGNVTAVITGSLAGISGYEYLKALHATIGCSVIFVGGGLPPTIRFLNAESLAKYEPQGFYSRKNLASLGCKDDQGFDRLKHGFSRFAGQPQSAIQKFLWKVIDGLNWDPGSKLS